MANPQRVIVQLGANVEQLVVGMQQAIGAIKGSTAQISGQLHGMSESSARASAEMQAALGHVGVSVHSLIRPLAELFTAYKAFETVKGFVELGLHANEAIESATLGVAAIISAQSTLRDSTGNVLTGVEALTAATRISAEQVEKLHIQGLQTKATSEDLFKGFETAVGIGLPTGASMDQLRNLTVLTAQAMGALGMDMGKLPMTLKAIETGSGGARNVLVKVLGVTKEWVDSFKEPGALIDALTAKLAPFGVAAREQMGSFAFVTKNIHEALEMIAEDLTKPLFASLSAGLGGGLSSLFNLDTGQVSGPLSGMMDIAREMFAKFGEAARAGIGWAVEAMRELGAWFQENRARVTAFGGAIGAFVGAGAGAFQNLLSAVLTLANAGLGPLTTLLNVAATLLSSTVGQVGLLAYAVSGPAMSAFAMLRVPVQGLIAAFQTMRVQMALASVAWQSGPAVSGIGAVTGALQRMGAGILASINPWVAAAVAIGAVGFALERYVTAGKRAAEESLRQAQASRAQVGEWQGLTAEAARLDGAMRSGNLTAEQHNDANERLKIILEQLNGLYPGFNALLVDESGNERSVADALKIANEERLRGIDIKIADARAELGAAQARVAARAVAMGEAGSFGPMKDVVSAFQGWRLKADAEAVGTLTKALNELLEAKKALTRDVPASAEPGSMTPNPRGMDDEEGKDKSKALVSKWRDELEAIKALKENWFTWDNAREVAFWQEKLALTTKGTEAYREIQSTLNKLTLQGAKEAHEQALKDAKSLEAARLEDIKRESASARERLKIEQEAAKEELKIRQGMLSDTAAYAEREVEIEDQHAQAMRDAGLISEAQYLEQLRAFEEARYQIRLKAIIDQLNLDFTDEENRRRSLAALAALEQQHRGSLTGIDDKGKVSTGGKVDNFISPMVSQWQHGLQLMLQGALTFRQAVRGLWQSIGQTFLQTITHMAAEWAAAHLKMLAMFIITKTKELLIHMGIMKAKTAVNVAGATTGAAASAVEAGAAGAASAAKIPFYGWAIAIGAGLAILMGVRSMMSSIPSAASGWDVPSGFSGTAMIHEREMVLPAPLAERVRDMTGGGGGGDTIHVNIGGIHALDGASVERVLMDNQGPLAKAIQRAHRDGRLRK